MLTGSQSEAYDVKIRSLESELQRCGELLIDVQTSCRLAVSTLEVKLAESQAREKVTRAEMDDISAYNMVFQRSLAEAKELSVQARAHANRSEEKTQLLVDKLTTVQALNIELERRYAETEALHTEQSSRAWELQKEKADLETELHNLEEILQRFELGAAEVQCYSAQKADVTGSTGSGCPRTLEDSLSLSDLEELDRISNDGSWYADNVLHPEEDQDDSTRQASGDLCSPEEENRCEI